jgi:hypothetical protein
MERSLFQVLIVLALLAIGVPALAEEGGPGPPSENGVEPVLVEGNPTCADLGYDRGFKPQPEPPPTGNYTFPDGVNTVSITSDGTFVDWLSSLSIDAVIVKGGPNASLFRYDPPAESFADSDLHAPVNPNNQTLYEISHVDFCYDYDKVGTGSIVIVKEATPDYYTDLFPFSSNTLPDAFELERGESRSFEDQPAGYAYTFSETVPQFWILHDIACDGAEASTVTIGAEGGFEDGDTYVTIELVAGEHVVCTFSNMHNSPPNAGVDLPAPLIVGGLTTVGTLLLAAGVVMLRRAGRGD